MGVVTLNVYVPRCSEVVVVMKKMSIILRNFLWALVILLSAHAEVKATHIYGADFFYTHVSGRIYRVSLVVYGDCSGGAFPSLAGSTPRVDVFNGTTLKNTITLFSQDTGVEVTPVCPAQLGNTSCKNTSFSIPGVKRYTYAANYTLDTESVNWRFFFNGNLSSTNQSGRSNSITNISMTGTPPSSLMQLEATLNNVPGPNSSPSYTTIPTPFFCINRPASYNPGTVDPNGNTLAYALVPGIDPSTSSGFVNYISPYTATNPLAVATGSYSFSTTTGQLNFTPNLAQRALVVNKVSEYNSSNVLVGTSMREMTFVVLSSCNNQPPGGNISNLSGGTLVSGTSVTACKGANSLTFNINPTDADLNTINMTWSGMPAGASFTVTNNNTTTPSAQFSWNLTNVTPGNYLFFITYADNGCPLSSRQTQAYTITINPQPTLTYTSVAPATCTKKAKFNVTPGLASPWTFSVLQGSTTVHSFPGITGQQADSLEPGTYTFRLSNANGCIKDTAITIAPPPAVTASVAMVPPTCYGTSTGTITVTAGGGLAPFRYAIGSTPFSANNIFTALPADAYSLHVIDSNDCTKDTVVVLTQPAEIVPSITFTQPPCNFFNSGSITVSASAGTAPYQYALGSGSFSGTNTFSGLYSGSYTLRIRDAKNCTRDTVFILPDSVKVQATAVLTNILCNGASTGVITLNASGATAPYQYQLGSGLLGTTNTFTTLPAGPHSFHIEDVNRCYLDTVLTLTQPTPLYSLATVSNVICHGDMNGSVLVNGTGGVAPYTFAQGAGTYTATNNFPGLGIGTYTFRVKDNNNCIKDTVITIVQPNPLAINTVTLARPDCYGYNNGTITIASAGGTTPYNYSLNGGGAQGSNFFNTLAAGNYALRVTDANGCIKDSAVVLQQPTPLVPAVQLKNSTCATLSNGVVTVLASGATPGYTYAVGSGTYFANATFTALAAGSYTFRIKDAKGCIKDTSLVIADSTFANLSPNITNAKCFGESSGSVSLTPVSGLAPYTYALGTSGSFGSTSLFANLAAGGYTVRIKDANGCIKDSAVAVAEPPVIQPNASINNITCNGLSNGQITFLSSGGTAPYTFAFGINPYTSNNVFANISAGQYKYSIKDANGCVVDTIIMMQQPAPVGLSFTKTDALCFGDSTGTVTITGVGGTTPYTYYTNTTAPQTSNIITGLPAASHIIFVKDANGCIFSQFANVGQPQKLMLDSIVMKGATCAGFADGNISVRAKGGVSPYMYSINGETFSSKNVFGNLKEGNYVIEVKDTNSCFADTSVTLNGFVPIVIDEILTDSVDCPGNNDGSITILASGGVAPLKYSILNQKATDDNIFLRLYAGSYSITITDSVNCKLDTSAYVPGPEKFDIKLAIVPNDCQGYDNNGSITAEVTGGTQPYNYLWSNGGTQPILKGMANGVYKLQLTDANGCKDSATADVLYDNCCKIFIPDAFTPNGDGKNDKIRILFKGDFKLDVFMIYNRFGQQVFTTNTILGKESDGWDGKVNGIIQDIGTYNYYVKGVCGNSDNKAEEYKGTIQLVK